MQDVPGIAELCGFGRDSAAYYLLLRGLMYIIFERIKDVMGPQKFSLQCLKAEQISPHILQSIYPTWIPLT
jgi:hypothetical protein